jgi:diadenylate cyclase
MDNFNLLIIITYLYAIFVLILDSKSTLIKAGISKIAFLILFGASLYYLIAEELNLMDRTVKIIAFVPAIFLLIMLLHEDFTKFYKKANMTKTREKTLLVNNDLAEDLYRSIDFLSKNKIGALITIERNVSLSKIANKALILNAEVSKELLTSIFIPNAPLHDGAVIIRGNKILCAKAYYPSSKRTDLPMHFGTRHRAALGISEQSDAFTIIVSEETGHVSVTINKEIEYNISRETLNLYFEKFLKIQ